LASSRKLIWRKKDYKKEIDECGKLNLKVNTKFRSNASFQDIIYEIWGEDNTCITSIKINEIKK